MKDLCQRLQNVISRLNNVQQHIRQASSFVSVSNPSIRERNDEEEDLEERSPSALFTWSKMDLVYQEYKATLPKKTEYLTQETIDAVTELFDYLIRNETVYAEEVYNSVMAIDNTYADRFMELALYNNENTGIIASHKSKPKDHLLHQIKKIFEFHRILLEAFQTDVAQALEILNLLALSHVLMRVLIKDFYLMDIAISKFLLRREIMDETNINVVVGYLNTITVLVSKYMNENRFENKKAELMKNSLTEYNSVNSVARENYRTMRRWKVVQQLIRRGVVDRNIEMAWKKASSMRVVNVPRQLENLEKADQPESTLLKWLKKGYKYKKEKDQMEQMESQNN